LKKWVRYLYWISDFEMLYVFDNGSGEEIGEYVREVLSKQFPTTYLRVEENLAFVQPYQEVYNLVGTDWILYMHNDLFIHEMDWDLRVEEIIKGINEKIGIVGIAGSPGANEIGARICRYEGIEAHTGIISNLRGVAKDHGLVADPSIPFYPAVMLDGMFLLCNMEFLDKVEGWHVYPFPYGLFQFYDYDISMEAISQGFKNIVIPLDATHYSGGGHNNSRFIEWYRKMRGDPEDNEDVEEGIREIFRERFMDIWLPCRVGELEEENRWKVHYPGGEF
jgi:hypothetical protein